MGNRRSKQRASLGSAAMILAHVFHTSHAWQGGGSGASHCGPTVVSIPRTFPLASPCATPCTSSPGRARCRKTGWRPTIDASDGRERVIRKRFAPWPTNGSASSTPSGANASPTTRRFSWRPNRPMRHGQRRQTPLSPRRSACLVWITLFSTTTTWRTRGQVSTVRPHAQHHLTGDLVVTYLEGGE